MPKQETPLSLSMAVPLHVLMHNYYTAARIECIVGEVEIIFPLTTRDLDGLLWAVLVWDEDGGN